jgi:hypothetical protein
MMQFTVKILCSCACCCCLLVNATQMISGEISRVESRRTPRCDSTLLPPIIKTIYCLSNRDVLYRYKEIYDIIYTGKVLLCIPPGMG